MFPLWAAACATARWGGALSFGFFLIYFIQFVLQTWPRRTEQLASCKEILRTSTTRTVRPVGGRRHSRPVHPATVSPGPTVLLAGPLSRAGRSGPPHRAVSLRVLLRVDPQEGCGMGGPGFTPLDRGTSLSLLLCCTVQSIVGCCSSRVVLAASPGGARLRFFPSHLSP